MSGHDEHDRLLEAATAAALKVLDDATDDDDAAEALWRRLCSDVFTYQLNSGDTADAFAAMANAKLQREGVPFRVVRVPSACPGSMRAGRSDRAGAVTGAERGRADTLRDRLTTMQQQLADAHAALGRGTD
jgi:hypothetical protein